MIKGLDDFRDVPFVARTPSWMAQYAKQVFHNMVQSLVIHPDWTLDMALCHMVNDEFMDPIDILGAYGGNVDELSTVWKLAAIRAMDVRRELGV